MNPEVELLEAGDVAYLTLRGPRLNSMTREMHHALAARLAEVRRMTHIRFVVIQGANGTFSSGGDLTQLRDGLPADYLADYDQRMLGTIGAITEMEQIVITVIQGAAIGAAAALAMSADLILCEEDAKLRLSFVHVGYVPDAGATHLLPALAGAVGRDLLLTGRLFSPAEAQSFGLISRLCSVGESASALEALLDELREAPAHALVLTKRLISGRARDAYLETIHSEGEMQPVAAQATTPEHVERVLQRIRGQRGTHTSEN